MLCFLACFRWSLHPFSLHFMEMATQGNWTPLRENLTPRSAHVFKDQVISNYVSDVAKGENKEF